MRKRKPKPPPFPELRNPDWLLPTAQKIASGIKRPSSISFEDSVQDACVIILERGDKYSRLCELGLSCSFDAWLVVMTRGRLSNLYEREYNWCARRVDAATRDDRSTLDLVESGVDHVADAEHADLRERLAAGFTNQERIIWSMLQDGISRAEMVETTGIGVALVAYYLKRLRNKLSDALIRQQITEYPR